MKRKILYLFLFFHLIGSAQMYYDDAQLWGYFYLEKKLNNKFDLHLKLQGRMENNFIQFGRGGADIGITYKFNKNIKILADYVFVQRKKNSDVYKTRHQYYAALVLKKEIGHWRFMYRNMFQCQYKNPLTAKTGYIPYYYDRNKITIKYEATKRLAYYVAEEINIPLNNPQIKGISRSRSFIGTLIKVTKRQQLELYFMYQVQLQNGDWYDQDDSYYVDPLKRNFVYGVGYSIEF